jgi:DNA processing protein
MDPTQLLALASTYPHASSNTASLARELARRGLSLVQPVGLSGPLAIAGTLPRHGVAIVGARAADPYGITLSRALGRAVAQCGLAVISGGAEGCDREAHEGALEVGGKTVVVLPAGHDHPYPRHHADLFARAQRNGAVVSPVWPTVPLARHRFIARNRVIAELACATVVVRAEARSGSLSTAAAARALGKPLGAVPGALGEALSEGVHRLLDEGAVAVTGPARLHRWLGEMGLAVSRPKDRWPIRYGGQPAPWPLSRAPADAGAHEDVDEPLCDEARGVLAVVAAEPGLDLDAIAVRSGLPLGDLTHYLLSLEMAQALERMPGGLYRPTGRGD